jgi:hypothetical protein
MADHSLIVVDLMSVLTAFSYSLIGARRSGIATLPDGRLPANAAEAYEIQAAVGDVFGKPGAFKATR